MSHRVARRRGGDAKALYKRVHEHITTDIWRRAARMVQACWPKTGAVRVATLAQRATTSLSTKVALSLIHI